MVLSRTRDQHGTWWYDLEITLVNAPSNLVLDHLWYRATQRDRNRDHERSWLTLFSKNSGSTTPNKGKKAGRDVEPLLVYEPIPSHQRDFPDDHLIMTSYKINVHNGHRTMQSKWLQEISHTNPALLNHATAGKLGIRDGDWIEVTSFRPLDPDVPRGDGSKVSTLLTRVRLTEGVHPLVIAIAHNAGRSVGGAYATNGKQTGDHPGYDTIDDADLDRLWWKGAISVPQNDLLPIYPDPVVGGQAYHDTVVQIRKV